MKFVGDRVVITVDGKASEALLFWKGIVDETKGKCKVIVNWTGETDVGPETLGLTVGGFLSRMEIDTEDDEDMKVKVFEGVVVPVKDWEVDCLHVVESTDQQFRGREVSITDFFPKTVDCYAKPGEPCLANCKYKDKDNICRAPAYKTKIIVKYKEVARDDE